MTKNFNIVYENWKGDEPISNWVDIFPKRNLKDPYLIAIKELQDRKCPLIIIRKIGDNKVEHWRCNEMGFPVDVDNVY